MVGSIKFPYRTIRDVDVRGKQILLRAGYNVPLKKDGTIADDFRVEMSLPTIKYLLDRGAKIVIVSHLGRPKGEVDEKLSLNQVAKNLSKKLDQPVKFFENCIGEEIQMATSKMACGDVVMLENLRFHPEEEKNDRKFAQELVKSSNADLFVQDAFADTHRAHASTSAITEFLPAVAGFLVEREYTELKSAIEDPNRPLTTIIGGAKISDKIPLIEKFIDISDNIIIGGAIANNFLKFQGYNIAGSKIDPDADSTVENILKKAKKKFGDKYDDKFYIPKDVAISENGDAWGSRVSMELDNLSNLNPESKIFDIGEKTIEEVNKVIESSGTVIWNGTLGFAENPEFAHGSARTAMALATHPRIMSIIGGGDTADFVRDWDALKGGSFTHVSTGGGASLELLAGNILPGIAVLMAR